MGKRRDRRSAAHGNAGRRLKLDLFAEPSGDLGGSSAQDEVEGLPNSPSSSENPLLLLGQYSDDDNDDGGGGCDVDADADADKERSRGIANDNEDDSNVENGNQGKGLLKDGSQDMDHTIRGDQLLHEFEKDVGRDYDALEDAQKLNGNSNKDSGESASVDDNQYAQHQANEHSDTQIVGDASFGWKMVLHEETNEYYYWNVETGETSWLVPDVLAQQAQVTGDPVFAAATEGMGDMASQNVDFTSCSASVVECGIETANPNGFATGEIGRSVEQHDEAAMTGHLGGEVNLYDSRHGSSGTSDMLLVQASIAASVEDHVKDLTDSRKSELGSVHFSHLINKAEQLLERLMKLESSKSRDSQDWVSKYTLEVEIRLSDMKSLVPHGSSLNPFWVHSERQLKRLESAVDMKTALLDKLSDNEVESKNIYDTLIEECNLLDTTDPDLKADHKKSKDAPAPSPAHAVQSQNLGDSKHVLLVNSPYRQSTGGETFSATAFLDGSTHYSSEDVDMDVDMEVDDVSPSSQGMVEQQPTEQFAELPIVANHDEFAVPPPPDDEWVPPPPPDSEPMPPPPPDEPEPAHPIAPPTEVVQPLPYSDQYSLSYSSGNYQFYGHPETATTNIYGQAEGYQVVLPPGSVSYGADFSAYDDSASAAASNVAPTAYYQQGAVYPVGVSSLESPLFPVQSDSLGYSTLALDQTGSFHAHAEAGGTKMQYITTKSPEMGSGTVVGFSGVPSTSAPSNSDIVEASATTSVKHSGSTLAANPGAAMVAATGDGKVQSKVTRGKKRSVALAPSLKSNKKVSSLVNKWKAAKEELEEDEEEEANGALAMLERKRQREIEEWRAQQIASGEAKENANFQPLGGDWRERVKRKRRANAKAIEEASAKETADNVKQKPDLAQLSRNLPSGWQALWDESSKQVYYGHMATSETTWVKPTAI